MNRIQRDVCTQFPDNMRCRRELRLENYTLRGVNRAWSWSDLGSSVLCLFIFPAFRLVTGGAGDVVIDPFFRPHVVWFKHWLCVCVFFPESIAKGSRL